MMLPIQVLSGITGDPTVAPEAYNVMGQCYEHKNDYAQAANCYETLLANYPTSSFAGKDTKYALANCYLLGKDWGKLETLSKDLVLSYPEDETLWQLRLGTSYQEVARFSAAMAEFQEGIDMAAENNDNRYIKETETRLADCYLISGSTGLAASLYQSLVTKYPESAAEYRYGIGMSYLRGYDFNTATTTFQSVATDFPNDYYGQEALLAVGECLYAQNRITDGETHFNSLLISHRSIVTRILRKYAECQNAISGEYEKALDTVSQASAQLPSDPITKKAEIIAGLSELWGMGKTARARTRFQGLLDEQNELDKMELRYYLAYCSYAERDYSSARTAFHAISDATPMTQWHIPAIYMVGDCCVNLGDDTGAREAFEEVQTLYPDSQYAPLAALRLAQLPKNQNIAKAMKIADVKPIDLPIVSEVTSCCSGGVK